jgi:hypothetical protein
MLRIIFEAEKEEVRIIIKGKVKVKLSLCLTN